MKYFLNIFLLLLFLFKVSTALKGQESFFSAMPGEIWLIKDDNIAVMRTSELPYPLTKDTFTRNLITIIKQNTKVQILESKGWLSPWKKVNVLSDDGIIATGWIIAETVKNASNLNKTQNLEEVNFNEWGTIRYTSDITEIRDGRSNNAKTIGQRLKNQKVKADFLKNGFWAIFDLNEKNRDEKNAIGYVFAPFLLPGSIEERKTNYQTKPTLKYKIIERTDVSYRGTPRMVYRVLLDVNKIPIEEQINQVAIYIWKDGNNKWKEFTIFFYLPEMNFHRVAYGIAMFSPNELSNFQINEFALYGTKWYK